MSQTRRPVSFSPTPRPAAWGRPPLEATEARRAIRGAETALLDARRLLAEDELHALARVPETSVPALAALAHEVRSPPVDTGVGVAGTVTSSPADRSVRSRF